MVSSRDRPREGARGAQRTYRGVHVDDHMDGHGEQPGPTPGGGAGSSENLQGGVQVDDHMDGHGEQPRPTPGGSAGRSENLQGGSREGLQGGTGPTGRAWLYRGDPASFLPSLNCDLNHLLK